MGIFKKIGDWARKQNQIADEYQFGEGGMYWDPRLAGLDPATQQALMRNAARQVWSGNANRGTAMAGLGDAAVAELERRQEEERREFERRLMEAREGRAQSAEERAKAVEERAKADQEMQTKDWEKANEAQAREEAKAGNPLPANASDGERQAWDGGYQKEAWKMYLDRISSLETTRGKENISTGAYRQRREIDEEYKEKEPPPLIKPGKVSNPQSIKMQIGENEFKEPIMGNKYRHPVTGKLYDSIEEYLAADQEAVSDPRAMIASVEEGARALAAIEQNPMWQAFTKKEEVMRRIIEAYNARQIGSIAEGFQQWLQQAAPAMANDNSFAALPQ